MLMLINPELINKDLINILNINIKANKKNCAELGLVLFMQNIHLYFL